MKTEFNLSSDFVSKKELVPFAILACIRRTFRRGIEVEEVEALEKVVEDFRNIVSFTIDPYHFLLESGDDINKIICRSVSFCRLDEDIKNLETYIQTPITINITININVKDRGNPAQIIKDLSQFIPKFDENKVKINIRICE